MARGDLAAIARPRGVSEAAAVGYMAGVHAHTGQPSVLPSTHYSPLRMLSQHTHTCLSHTHIYFFHYCCYSHRMHANDYGRLSARSVACVLTTLLTQTWRSD